MRVDLSEKNPALMSLLENPGQTIFLDANFLIPPDRTKIGAKPIPFQKYCEIWLEPVFDSFLALAMHESVLLEVYDVIFYLCRIGKYDNKGLRLLYKYQYYLTKKEKLQNPEWGDFMKTMNLLYLE